MCWDAYSYVILRSTGGSSGLGGPSPWRGRGGKRVPAAHGNAFAGGRRTSGMALGDLYEATAGETTDLYYVDTGMYDTAEYGSVYILDAERPALVDTGIGTNHERILDAIETVGLA